MRGLYILTKDWWLAIEVPKSVVINYLNETCAGKIKHVARNQFAFIFSCFPLSFHLHDVKEYSWIIWQESEVRKAVKGAGI